jgi:hypothetical protein
VLVKRGKPLRTKKPLRANPTKVAAWQYRSRKPLNPGTPKVRKVIATSTRSRVAARSGGKCIVCYYHADPDVLSPGPRRMAHLHHVLPVQTWPEYETEERNLVGVCAPCHDEHERAHRRIPFAALPKETVHFVYDETTPQAIAYLEKTYPTQGGQRG